MKKGNDKKKSGNQLAVLIAVTWVLVLCGAAFVFGMQSHHGAERWVMIPGEASRDQIADSLEKALGASAANKIMLFYRLMGGEVCKSDGAYLIKPGTLYARTAWQIKNGRQTPVKLTFNNVRTVDELAGRVARTLELKPEEFKEACERRLPELGFSDRRQYAAAFLPDTYEFYWTDSADDVVRKLTEHRSRFWNDERRAKARALGLTPVEVATLTSIAQEETMRRKEIPTVARLYLNRLAKGMKLQADPTVKFATGNFGLRRILRKHLATESPYNTYLHTGLPPGPIRIADDWAIDAVLDAPKHKYLYMCAREDFSGYHNFASDFATHQANARRYQAELDKRNIK